MASSQDHKGTSQERVKRRKYFSIVLGLLVHVELESGLTSCRVSEMKTPEYMYVGTYFSPMSAADAKHKARKSKKESKCHHGLYVLDVKAAK
jgi:hypothetical protein